MIPRRVSSVLWDCENLGGVQRTLTWGGSGRRALEHRSGKEGIPMGKRVDCGSNIQTSDYISK